jgi:UDP-3-O-acyl-N-acetylglucosamine deacetylase
MIKRRRLARPLRLRGWALFRGGPASVSLTPGRPGQGWRWALGSAAFEVLEPAQLQALQRRSSLSGTSQVQLCEHLLAALLLASIDDCDIRFHQPEAPILDGSAGPWLRAIKQAGIRGPSPQGQLEIGVTWRGKKLTWKSVDTGQRIAPVARARTFISQKEAEQLRRGGLFPGARPGCALVLDSTGKSALYGGRPRLREEPLNHKLLDALGDLGPWRARGRITGRLWLEEPGHSTNKETISAAFADGRLVLHR